MLKNKEIRRIGRENLRGNYGTAVVNILLIFLLVMGFQYLLQSLFLGGGSFWAYQERWTNRTFFGTLLASAAAVTGAVAQAMLQMGNLWGYLDIQEGEPLTVSHLFLPFQQRIGPTIRLMVMKNGLILLFSLLLFIPGAVKYYQYALVEFLYYDNPDLTPGRLLQESRSIMHGYKGKLFFLDLYYFLYYLIPLFLLLAVARLGFLSYRENTAAVSSEYAALALVIGGAVLLLILLAVMLALAFLIEPRRLSAKAAFYNELLQKEEEEPVLPSEAEMETETQDDAAE